MTDEPKSRVWLAEARTTLIQLVERERTDVEQLAAEAVAAGVAAVEAYERGDYSVARANLEKACDAEFDAFFDCEAFGALQERLFPEDP